MTNREFTALVAQYQSLLYTICYQLVQKPEVAQDLAQDAFFSAWQHMDACPVGFERQWLARIATNKARDYLKSAWNRKVNTPGDAVLMLSGAPPDAPPEKQVADSEGEAWLHALIYALKEPYHAPAVLHFLQGYSVDETAKKLGRPPKTVSAQLFRARKMLQKQIVERRAKDELVL